MNRFILNNTNGLVNRLTVLLLVMTILVMAAQIWSTGKPASSQMLTALFSILQFFFSLAFSWLLTQASLKNEFEQSQKRFALSAYRRILEIREANDRLLSRISSIYSVHDINYKHEVIVFNEISKGIKASIVSSIADWVDIIGREIETVEQLRNLDEEKIVHSREESREAKKLIHSLPNTLRFTVSQEREKQVDRKLEISKHIDWRKEELGYIPVEGFFAPSSNQNGVVFDCKELSFKVGDKLNVEEAIAPDGTPIFIVKDNNGYSVAMLTNNIPEAINQKDFVDLLTYHLLSDHFPTESISIENNNALTRFKAKIAYPRINSPDHAS